MYVGIGVGLSVRIRFPSGIFHRGVYPAGCFARMPCPKTVWVMCICREVKGLTFFFGLFEEVANEGKISGRIAPHAGLIIFPKRRHAEFAFCGSMFSDYSGKVSVFV